MLRKIVEPWIQGQQFGFHPGCNTVEHTSQNCVGGLGSLAVLSTCVLWLWRRLMTLSSKVFCGSCCRSMGYLGCLSVLVYPKHKLCLHFYMIFCTKNVGVFFTKEC
ncbi:hypothetical protein ATANTOWER_006233 [Ataeniobius toweri]|uniref:Uncharacterized protein n=1 Tax=Ataeniobius toweri TaxID=208326 RepID=A0ABU7CEX1_9TELE|nr:hypothetical protein [Ataeniobius toweri]